MSVYGQYCPLALATEILGERWNLLIISRVVDGCHRFNDIHRGVPKISATLLSRRLKELEHFGIVSITPLADRRGHHYQITEAGKALAPIIDAVAVWGQEWARDMGVEDLDPGFLVWSMHLRLDTSAMPPGRTVMHYRFSGTPTEFRQFWLVNTDGNVDMCLKDPGYEIDLKIESDLRLFIEAWRGFRDLRQEIARGKIMVDGPSHLARQLPDWLLLSALAPYARKTRGRERALQSG